MQEGFLLYDLKKLVPGIKIYGIEDHKYPIDRAVKEVKNELKIGEYHSLPFKKIFRRSFCLSLYLSIKFW